MTNRTDSAPFLSEAPINDKLLNEDGTLTDSWRNWFNAITRTLGYSVTHARFDTSKEETPITEMVTIPTTAKRDDLQNPTNAKVIYNEETGRFNFREGGTWVTFTPVAA